MAVSKAGAATRAFVGVLLVLARSYKLLLEVNRESSEEQLVKAYRRLLLKTHPDKGGKAKDQTKLNLAKGAWDEARGREKAAPVEGRLVVARQEYRVSAAVVLLTYQGVVDLEQWHRFVAFARAP